MKRNHVKHDHPVDYRTRGVTQTPGHGACYSEWSRACISTGRVNIDTLYTGETQHICTGRTITSVFTSYYDDNQTLVRRCTLVYRLAILFSTVMTV